MPRIKYAIKKVLNFKIFLGEVAGWSFLVDRVISIMPKTFYAVKAGLQPGIYPTWTLCEEQIKGVKGAIFRKFGTIDQAADFIGFSGAAYSLKLVPNDILTTPTTENGLTTPITDCGPITPDVDVASLKRKLYFNDSPPEKKNKTETYPDLDWKPPPIKVPHDLTPIEVYTDGACGGNGKKRAKGGIGVYWGPSHPCNVSEPLHGRQTNNRAEIMAAVKAVCQARQMGKINLTLCTDSQFMIKGITLWIRKWRNNGWKTGDDDPVINKEDFQKLDLAKRDMNITWKHVRGHRGVPGNEAADKLAVAGASKK